MYTFNPQLTTEATSSPEPMTDLINKTTAMPAVLWTAWMNSSVGRERNRGGKEGRVCAVCITVVIYCFSFASLNVSYLKSLSGHEGLSVEKHLCANDKALQYNCSSKAAVHKIYR